MKTNLKYFIMLLISILCCLNSLTAQTTLTMNSTNSVLFIENNGYSWDFGATIILATGPYIVSGSGDVVALALNTTISDISITTQNLTAKNTDYDTGLLIGNVTNRANIVFKGINTFQSGNNGIGCEVTTKCLTLSGDTLYAIADSTKPASFTTIGIGYPGVKVDSLIINSGYIVTSGKYGISEHQNVIINDGVITAIGITAYYGIKANKIVINGGSVKSTGNNVAAVNAKGEKVYCVTLPHNGVLSVGMNNGSKDTTLAFQAHHEDDANFYLYLPDGSYTFTCGSKQYKATVAGSAVVAKELAVTAVAGFQSVDVSSLGFSNADILTLISTELSDTTAAVVAKDKIDFYAPAATTYSVSKKSTVTASLKTSIYPGTYNTTGLGGCNLTGYYKGKPRYYGSANEPITALTHFVGVGTKASGDVSSSWKALNTFLGLDQYGTTTVSGGPCWILAEDRNETTGKLLSSIYFDPSIGVAGPDALKGPHGYNMIFNPTDSVINVALKSHSTYKNSTTLQASALDSIKAVRDADSTVVVANVGFMRAFSTQAKTYTFDIATLSLGKFKSGDVLEINYLLGSYDATVYHSGTSAATSVLEAIAQLQVGKDTVDADGYVNFNMYGGGFFSIAKIPLTVSVSARKAEKSHVYGNKKNIWVVAIAGSQVDIYNLTGQRVLGTKTTSDKQSFAVDRTGIYLVKVSNANGCKSVKCLVE
jgi:hypothetical protein